MQFVKMYEAIYRATGGNFISLGLFNSYEAANDAAITEAAKELPKETVCSYQITEIYVNLAALNKWS